MIRLPWLSQPLTEQQVDRYFMVLLEDDTEEKPWMVMGDLQFWSAASFAFSLRIYARERQLPWYVASRLPIRFTWPEVEGIKQLAPDVIVALVADHPRLSYNVDAEGSFPPFVLEVVSPSSSGRDQVDKRKAYEMLGVQEYVLFTPRDGRPSLLAGHRRAESGRFEPWSRDEQGRLRSHVLGLSLVVNGQRLQAETPEGHLLLTPEQAVPALADEARARREAEQALAEEARARREAEVERDVEARARREAEEARRRAESELQRLRDELNRLRDEPANGAT